MTPERSPGAADANLANLTELWHAQGSEAVPLPSGGTLHVSDSWPDRLWVAPGSVLSPEDRVRWGEVWTARTRPGQVVRFGPADARPDRGGPASPAPALSDPAASDVTDPDLTDPDLGGARLERGAVLIAMDLDLVSGGAPGRWAGGGPAAPFRVEPVGARLDAWVAAGSEAFGYRIERAPVERLAADPRAELWLALEGARVVGTGLAFRTDDTLGLHQLGVVPAARRRGLAGAVLRHLLHRAQATGARRATLQASPMGEGLYRREGFVPVGTVHLHRRPRA